MAKQVLLTSRDAMRESLDMWFRCPNCEKISQGWSYSEEVYAKTVLRSFKLNCGHTFPTLKVLLPAPQVKHVEIMPLWVCFETKTSAGRLVQRVYERAHSYIPTFMPALYGNFSGGASYFTVNTSDVAKQPSIAGTTPGVTAGSSNANYGVVVGTGTAANTTGTFALQTQIAQGTGAGQLNHSSVSVSTYTITSPTTQFTVSRTFTNNSGGSITINEVGIYYIDNATQYFCLLRDVLGTPVTVLNGNTTTATYTISISTS
jgi:hypothetical protein